MSFTHVKVLQFGKDNPGFTVEELKAEFPDDFHWISKEIQHSKVFQTTEHRPPYHYYLSFEDSFRLLEYEELNDVRKSSRNAMIVATISILLTLTSVFYQINSPQN